MAKKKRYYGNKPGPARVPKAAENDNRYVIILCAAVVMELVQLLQFRLLNGTSIYTMLAVMKVIHILAIVSPIVFVVSLVLWLATKRTKQWRGWIMAVFLFLTVSMGCTDLWFIKGVKFVAVLLVFLTVLAFIYVVYQRDFFCSCAVIACGIGALTIYRRSAAWGQVSMRALIVFLIGFVLLIAAALVIWRVKKGEGYWTPGENARRLLPQQTEYRLLFATLIIVALALIAALIFGSMAAYFALFVLGVYFFLLAVYYTVKLV